MCTEEPACIYVHCMWSGNAYIQEGGDHRGRTAQSEIIHILDKCIGSQNEAPQAIRYRNDTQDILW